MQPLHMCGTPCRNLQHRFSKQIRWMPACSGSDVQYDCVLTMWWRKARGFLPLDTHHICGGCNNSDVTKLQVVVVVVVASGEAAVVVVVKRC